MKTFDSILLEWNKGLRVLQSIKPSYHFIRNNKIWQGLMKYGWVSKIFIAITVFFGIALFNLILNWPIETAQSEPSLEPSGFWSSLDILKVFSDRMIVSGIGKYLLLLILEVVIFHCSVKTLNIISGGYQVPVFDDFVNAEIRMVKIIIRSIIMEFFTIIIVSIIAGIFFPNWVKEIAYFLVHAFYFGYAFMDNYNEQYGLNIKESSKIIKKHKGAAICIGIVVYGLTVIPIFGLIIAPVYGSVLATIYMYYEGVNKAKERHLEGNRS